MKKLLFVISIFVTSVFTQNIQDWQTFSYMNNVTDILHYDNHIWVTSTGGAYDFNISDSTTEVYTNVEGLSSINLSSLAKDQYNNMIFMSFDGKISVYSLDFNNWSYENSLAGQNVSDIEIIDDTLWVAADRGIGVFVYNGSTYDFRDFYDDLPIIPEQSNKIAHFDNKIFYASINGLLYASSDFVKFNLKSKDLSSKTKISTGIISPILSLVASLNFVQNS